ncbi:MAG TPA: carboxypeptidase regulatory-like domain-containing protein, partial [Acidobacteriota bacterium]
MQSRFFVLMSVVVLVCLMTPVFAQQRESGAIVGHITDSEGGPVPGVKVTAASSERGESVTYTDKEGYYRFPVLSPGTYEIKSELEGFQTVVRSDVRLFVGKTATVDMTISGSVEEAVVVTGETPLIDATTTASSKTVPIETIENLPKTSFALDLFTLTPGIGDLSYVAYGAGGSQANAYWFDGVDISNPVDGSYWIYPNYNWIEEVDVVGIGAPAEYGGFSGVITNSVSRSGSNEFHGLFETFFENDSLVGNNIDDPTIEDLGPDHIDRFSDTTAQLGGRLIRDKLWFFSSFEYYYDKSNPFGFPPDNSGFIGKITQPRILNKFTYKMNENNTLQGFAQWDTWKNNSSCSSCRFYLPEATSNSKGPEWFYNASWVSILNPETVVDVRYSGYNSTIDTTPKNGDIPQHCDANTQICSQNAATFRLRDRIRNQVNGSLSYHARDFIHGDHDFKFGIEYEHSNADTVDGYNGGAYYYDGLGLNYYDPSSPNFY